MNETRLGFLSWRKAEPRLGTTVPGSCLQSKPAVSSWPVSTFQHKCLEKSELLQQGLDMGPSHLAQPLKGTGETRPCPNMGSESLGLRVLSDLDG